MARVVIIGGGWAGCAASLAARKAGAEVTLLERTDQLLGTGLVGGIMRNNGRFVAAEEMIAMGGGELFLVTDQVARHRNMEFPGHKHATLYDVALAEPAVRRVLSDARVDVRLEQRVTGVVMNGDKIVAVEASADGASVRFAGDAFVDTTGTAGPQGNCMRYGNGCVMCILRCPSFGPRVSVAEKAGVAEKMGRTSGGQVGAMSGSCKIMKESLAPAIQEQLNRTGVAIVPLPDALRKKDLSKKACQQYALPEFADNLILLDTGHAKLMSPFFPLEALRSVPGLENTRFEDPYAAGKGNSIRYLAMSPHDEALRVDGVENLFCGGEKTGPLVGHTEAICTGTLAGHNTVRYVESLPLLVLPADLAVGDAIQQVTARMRGPEEGLTEKYTFSGSVYFERMKRLGLYTTDVSTIQHRVDKAGLEGVFSGLALAEVAASRGRRS